jgi:probable HAF family extracellular repeat protein
MTTSCREGKPFASKKFGSFGLDISDPGQVVGWSYLAGDRNQHAFLYDGTMHDLGSLFGYNSTAVGINNQGVIVGASSTSTPSITRAFIFTQVDGMIDLNSLIDPSSGWVLTGSSAINDFGQIVGVGTHSGQSAAFLLTPVPEPTTATPLVLGMLRCGAGANFDCNFVTNPPQSCR